MKSSTQTKAAKTFEDLVVWQKSRDLTKLVYRLTRKFPPEEQYNLVAQMRRAAISVSLNIAEGFSRHLPRDKERFYVLAAGSLSELLSQMISANDLNYISTTDLTEVRLAISATQSLLMALLKVHRLGNS